MFDKNEIGWFAHSQFIERSKVFEKKYKMIDCIIPDGPDFRKKKLMADMDSPSFLRQTFS
jgi:hypothetical protein